MSLAVAPCPWSVLWHRHSFLYRPRYRGLPPHLGRRLHVVGGRLVTAATDKFFRKTKYLSQQTKRDMNQRWDFIFGYINSFKLYCLSFFFNYLSTDSLLRNQSYVRYVYNREPSLSTPHCPQTPPSVLKGLATESRQREKSGVRDTTDRQDCERVIWEQSPAEGRMRSEGVQEEGTNSSLAICQEVLRHCWTQTSFLSITTTTAGYVLIAVTLYLQAPIHEQFLS
jgi:hypothetical protein